MTYDFKTQTPASVFTASTAFFFGADSQSAANPALYQGTLMAAAILGGTTGQIQYNSGGTAFGGAAALAYATSGINLTITASASNVIPLTIIGASGQSVHSFDITANGGSAGGLFYVDNDGCLGVMGNFIMRSETSAILKFGDVDASSPVAQGLQMQNVVAGTSNTAGANFTMKGSVGTGTGAGGQLIFQTAPASTTGTTQNSLATGLTITAPASTMQPSVVVGNQALATTATDGFLYIPTCAGVPTGTPTSFTGRVALIYDTTDNKFYIYNGSWKGGTAPGTWS